MHRSTNREAGTAEEISEKFRPVLTSKDDTIFELQEVSPSPIAQH